jgi:hypothetical protein
MSNRVLVPEDLHRNGRAAVASLARAGLAIALHAVDRATYPNPHQHVVRSWATDREAALLVRAASEPPAEMANTAALLRTIVVQFFESFGPKSAGVQLFGRSEALVSLRPRGPPKPPGSTLSVLFLFATGP